VLATMLRDDLRREPPFLARFKSFLRQDLTFGNLGVRRCITLVLVSPMGAR
jgi:hypothetical protein